MYPGYDPTNANLDTQVESKEFPFLPFSSIP